MKLEAGKEMDRCCVLGWLNEVYRHPTVAFNTYSDEQQIEFAHDALALLTENEELVRCKDCKHFHKEEKAMVANQYCSNLHRAVANDWFCADGERKEYDS